MGCRANGEMQSDRTLPALGKGVDTSHWKIFEDFEEERRA